MHSSFNISKYIIIKYAIFDHNLCAWNLGLLNEIDKNFRIDLRCIIPVVL